LVIYFNCTTMHGLNKPSVVLL